MTPNPNRNLYPFQRIITNFRSNPTRSRRDLVQILRDLARSSRYSTKSRSDLLFLSDLNGANQISALVIKPEANSNQPETDKTRAKKSDRSILGQNFHPPESFVSSLGWAQTRPDLIREQPY